MEEDHVRVYAQDEVVGRFVGGSGSGQVLGSVEWVGGLLIGLGALGGWVEIGKRLYEYGREGGTCYDITLVDGW